MISRLKLEDFTRLVVRKIEELNKEVVLNNPNGDSIFPCYLVQTPLCRDILTEDSIPVRQGYSIAIEQWTDKKYDALKMSDEVDLKLRELNFTRTNTLLDTFDDITKKYRLIVNYEVNYNGLYNSFELIR